MSAVEFTAPEVDLDATLEQAQHGPAGVDLLLREPLARCQCLVPATEHVQGVGPLGQHAPFLRTVSKLACKREGLVEVRKRIGVLVTVVLFLMAGIWTAFGLNGYAITSVIAVDGPSNPLLKTVTQVRGQWFANFGIHKWMMLAPALAILGPLAALALTTGRRAGFAFVASALGIFGVISTAGVSMFPFLMPSDIMPQASLTIWDATSSQLTLFVMLRVPRDEGASHRQADRREFGQPLLRSTINVVFRLDSRPWFCVRLRHSQCRLA